MTARIFVEFIFIFCLMLLGCLLIDALAQTRPKYPPLEIDRPVAVAKLCGNRLVTQTEKSAAFEQIQAEGCEEVRFLHIENGWFLAYGTKVLIGEAEADQ